MLYMVVQEKSRPGCPGCLSYERLARSQTHMMNWWATEEKTNKQLGCETESKNSWRLTSRSRESSLTWIHSDRAGAQNCTEALSCELIVAMPFIIQSVSLFPTLYWPDPLALLPRWSPADSEDHRAPRCFMSARYAFTVTTGDILSPHIYVSRLKPVTLCFRGQEPGTPWMSVRYEVEEKHSVCQWTWSGKLG